MAKEKKRRRRRRHHTFLYCLLLLIIIGGGSYYLFRQLSKWTSTEYLDQRLTVKENYFTRFAEQTPGNPWIPDGLFQDSISSQISGVPQSPSSGTLTRPEAAGKAETELTDAAGKETAASQTETQKEKDPSVKTDKETQSLLTEREKQTDAQSRKETDTRETESEKKTPAQGEESEKETDSSAARSGNSTGTSEADSEAQITKPASSTQSWADAMQELETDRTTEKEESGKEESGKEESEKVPSSDDTSFAARNDEGSRTEGEPGGMNTQPAFSFPDVSKVTAATAEQREGTMTFLLLATGMETEHSYGDPEAICLLTINERTKEVYLNTIYKDLLVGIPEVDGLYPLWSAYSAGCGPLLAKTVEYNFGIPVDHYLAVDYEGMAEMIDATGRVYVMLDEAEIEAANQYIRSMSEQIKYDPLDYELKKTGFIGLNGIQAVAYARISEEDLQNANKKQAEKGASLAGLNRASATDEPQFSLTAASSGDLTDWMNNLVTDRQLEIVEAIADNLSHYDRKTVLDLAGKLIYYVRNNLSPGDYLSIFTEVTEDARLFTVETGLIPSEGSTISWNGSMWLADPVRESERLKSMLYAG